MRLIDADELLEHAYRDKLDSRELIANMIKSAPTVKEIPINIPLSLIIKALEQEPKTDILEKIIADIDGKISHYDHFSSSNTANGLTMAKEIVKKYRESEGMI